MKKTIFCFLLALSFFLTSNYVVGQDDVKQKNFNTIIKISGDTIKPQIISKKPSESNENQVTFKEGNSVLILNAADIISYFDGTSKFHSENINGKEEKKLINYIVTGPLYLGRSISKDGQFTYYLTLEHAKDMIDLGSKKYDIIGFLKTYLNDFEQFNKTYNKPIYYNYKSLAEFASAYNAYKDPKTYVATTYSNPETIKVGVLASINSSQLKFKKDNISENATTFSVGLNFSNQFSRVVSLDIHSMLNLATFSYPEEEAKINTFEISPTLGLGFFLNEMLCIKVNAGVSMLYNIGSKVDINAEGRSVSIKGLNFGYIGGATLLIKSKYGVYINYQGYSFKTKNFDPAGFPSARSGELKSMRIGFLINF